jgi:hypothetical protein
VPFEVSCPAAKRIVPVPGRACYGLRSLQLRRDIHRSQLDPAAVHVPDPIDRKQDFGACRACQTRGRLLEFRDERVQAAVQTDPQRRRAKRPRLIKHLDAQLVGPIREARQIGLDRKRRLAEIAADPIERAEVLDHRFRRGCRRSGRAAALAKRHVRGQPALQGDRRAVDLLESDRKRLRRVGDDAIGAEDERDREIQLVGPRLPPEQRHALRVEPPELAVLAQPRRVVDLLVERVDLRLELSLRRRGHLPRVVLDPHEREVRQRLGRRNARHEEEQQDGARQSAIRCHGRILGPTKTPCQRSHSERESPSLTDRPVGRPQVALGEAPGPCSQRGLNAGVGYVAAGGES